MTNKILTYLLVLLQINFTNKICCGNFFGDHVVKKLCTLQLLTDYYIIYISFNLADFVVQEEDAPSIFEALRILRQWNPTWKPPFFMTDYSLPEINGIESCMF